MTPGQAVHGISRGLEGRLDRVWRNGAPKRTDDDGATPPPCRVRVEHDGEIRRDRYRCLRRLGLEVFPWVLDRGCDDSAHEVDVLDPQCGDLCHSEPRERAEKNDGPEVVG